MSVQSKFLHCLLSSPLREAYLRGKIVFVVSSQLDEIIWTNGLGARYLGFRTVSEAMGIVNSLDDGAQYQISTGLKTGQNVQLRGHLGARNFIVRSIVLPDDRQAVLVECVSDDLSVQDKAHIIAGIADQKTDAAIVTAKGAILAQSKHFSRFHGYITAEHCAVSQAQLQSFSITLDGDPFQIAILRFNDTRGLFLIIAYYDEEKQHAKVEQQYRDAMRKQEEPKKPDVGQWLSLDNVNPRGAAASSWVSFGGNKPPTEAEELATAPEDAAETAPEDAAEAAPEDAAEDGEKQQPKERQEEEKSKPQAPLPSGLSEDERSAFREIAERLRSDIKANQAKQMEELKSKTQAQATVDAGAAPTTAQHSSANDLYSLLNITSEGVVLLSNEGSIVFVNDSAAAVLGHDVVGLYKKPLINCFDADSQYLLAEYLQELQLGKAQTGTNDGRQLTVSYNNGKQITVFVKAVVLQSAQGFGVVMYDLASPHAQQTAFPGHHHNDQEAALALIQTAHEIRTPLNAMIGFAEIMREERFGALGDARYRDYARDIAHSAHHIMSLVNALLAQNKDKTTNNGKPAEPDGDADIKRPSDFALSLPELLRECIALMQEQADRNGINLRLSFSDDVQPINVEARVVRQILLNLLSNAVRFTAKGGQIILSAQNIEHRRVLLCVRDTGVGMTAAELDQALQPFGQVSRRDGRQGNEAFQGTGLGLPMVKSMVEARNGEFSITSYPAQGTTVFISFLRLRQSQS